MTIKPKTSESSSNFMQKSWAWLKAVDEAVNYDPNEQLHQRIEMLEAKIKMQDK